MSNDLRNTKEFSVSEISRTIKGSIEREFSYVKVRGEIGRISRPASGHLYLDLKDESAVLASIIWRAVAGKLSVKLEEGLEVSATGRLTTFPGQSRYQLIIESVSLAGAGALMAMLEKRKADFIAEGLFDSNKKKKLPAFPKLIGVITSESGAVFHDILHRLRDRFPTEVLLWPVAVQGESCSKQVSDAIKGFNTFSETGLLPRPDLIIVARGGGSVEDLWSFNDEVVVRETYNSTIPIISAIGHETDTTLIDFVSDLRAPTPTAAAEMAVPVRDELISHVEELSKRSSRSLSARVDNIKITFSDLKNRFKVIEAVIFEKNQRLDNVSLRLPSTLKFLVNKKKLDLAKNRIAAFRPKLLREDVVIKSRQVVHSFKRLSVGINMLVLSKRQKLVTAKRLHNTLGYKQTLSRGFLVARDGEGCLIKSSRNILESQKFKLEFFDGEINVKSLKT